MATTLALRAARFLRVTILLAALSGGMGLAACGSSDADPSPGSLDDAAMRDLVRRSYQYVAMYNVNNKAAMVPGNPMGTEGWNRVRAPTGLADHTLTMIARPNNDTPYTVATLDLRAEPMVLEIPAFDTDYASLMVTAYDHYVNIPLSTRQGDFGRPTRVLFYTQRTRGYDGAALEGVDRTFEATGDFVSAIFRVMPHANEPARMRRNFEAMAGVRVRTLSEYTTGAEMPDAQEADFPPYGQSDFDLFENNFLEVMQFVVNHTTFDPADELDQAFLRTLEPLGVTPGRMFSPDAVAALDGARLRTMAEEEARGQMALATDAAFQAANGLELFKPKGQMTLERLLFQSVIGPIGQPAAEAVYPAIGTTDGAPMNAMHDYVLRMTAAGMPPAKAFWSLTVYDSQNGYFIPNERKKYSVGQNAGMKLDADGGITIHVAAEQPAGVPVENWLPLQRGDAGVDLIMRLYAPDLDAYRAWTPPKAEVVR
jgi:hypothetical protein